ncbi:GNAT family N-acetyltransferase [Herbidospora mongoliensis]|uniref:GNAT family N-acetyltransferase n=1 Tax=Herbidospora mongoliensis TaxID=688067 RepID=UPI0008378450|nr:GNAT family N-acetyltransferase [Herbidospora mongoliensis]
MTVVLHTPPHEPGPPLTLRPWAEEDIPDLIDAYRDPVMRQWTRSHVDDERTARRWIDTQERGWSEGTRLSFAVLEPEADRARLVANVVVKGVTVGGASAEVGYWTTRAARGRGIAGRALEVVTIWAFAARGLRTLRLLHQVDNQASCRVAQKCGYALEAVLPPLSPYPRDGHLHARHAPQVPPA